VSLDTYRCPYCCSDIPAQAIVCRHCTRDLAFFRPLTLELQALGRQVQELQATVARQDGLLQRLQGQPDLSRAAEPAGLRLASASAAAWGTWLGLGIVTVALLGLCHWVLLFVYDAPPVYLRVLTIVLPMLTAYLCARLTRLHLAVQLLSALAVGPGAVVLMLAITAAIDHVPLWPANAREWRETVEYTVAIVLACFSGALGHHLKQRMDNHSQHQLRLSVLLEREPNGKLRIAEISNQMQSLISALAPLASAGTALYSGLKIFMGD
jgi:hypothetical protein